MTRIVRRAALQIGLAMALAATAARVEAQTRTTTQPPPDRGYIEVVGQSAFGNVTSQSYGVEVGATVWEDLQIFGEVGNIRNVATPEISAAAQAIAGALSQVQSSAVTYSVKEPVTFFGGGVRYPFRLQDTSIRPYVLGGFGLARVKKDVVFQLGGADASSTLSQYVTFGTDLSGEETKPMLTLGGGVVWPAWERLILDFQYRFGRIFTGAPSGSSATAGSSGINVSRAGLGIGVRF